jgi:hypothetical protein
MCQLLNGPTENTLAMSSSKVELGWRRNLVHIRKNSQTKVYKMHRLEGMRRYQLAVVLRASRLAAAEHRIARNMAEIEKIPQKITTSHKNE